jgi:hypothetical protein
VLLSCWASAIAFCAARYLELAGLLAPNPGLSLPDAQITVVHRSDGSGTTYIFANYLSSVDPAWAAKVRR